MRNTFEWEKPGISGKRTLIDTWDVGRLWLRRGIQNLIPSRCLLFVCWFINPSVYKYKYIYIYIHIHIYIYIILYKYIYIYTSITPFQLACANVPSGALHTGKWKLARSEGINGLLFYYALPSATQNIQARIFFQGT